MGMEYEELYKTISINILDYRLWHQTRSTILYFASETEGFRDRCGKLYLELPKMYQKWKAGGFKGARPAAPVVPVVDGYGRPEITQELRR